MATTTTKGKGRKPRGKAAKAEAVVEPENKLTQTTLPKEMFDIALAALVKGYDVDPEVRRARLASFESPLKDTLKHLNAAMQAAAAELRREVKKPWESPRSLTTLMELVKNATIASHNLSGHAGRLLDEAHSQTNSMSNEITVELLEGELTQLCREFEEVTVTGGYLTVVTEPVILEGVNLGRMTISLVLAGRIINYNSGHLHIAAKTPKRSHSGHFHPHVKGRTLCAGASFNPIVTAFRQGRICDAFLLVKQTLMTYNKNSPYAPMHDWPEWQDPTGNKTVVCKDCCGSFMPENVVTCDVCAQHVCNGCSESCDGCDEAHCASCMRTCIDCTKRFCKMCLEDYGDQGACQDCCAVCDDCENRVRKVTLGVQCPHCQRRQHAEETQKQVQSAGPSAPQGLDAVPIFGAVGASPDDDNREIATIRRVRRS